MYLERHEPVTNRKQVVVLDTSMARPQLQLDPRGGKTTVATSIRKAVPAHQCICSFGTGHIAPGRPPWHGPYHATEWVPLQLMAQSNAHPGPFSRSKGGEVGANDLKDEGFISQGNWEASGPRPIVSASRRSPGTNFNKSSSLVLGTGGRQVPLNSVRAQGQSQPPQGRDLRPSL